MKLGPPTVLTAPSPKPASILHGGGGISLLNNMGNTGISQYHPHHPFNENAHHHSGIKFMPIKSEPTVN